MSRSLRCRLGMHTWVVHQESGIDPYHECVRCKKVMENKPRMTGPFGQ